MADNSSENPAQKQFKETAATYAAQGGNGNNAQNKESFYANLDGFIKEGLTAGKTPDEVRQDITRLLNDLRDEGLAESNQFGDGKITTMQKWAAAAMDRVARYYDTVNGSVTPANIEDTRSPTEKFRDSAVAYATQSGAEKNNANKKSFYANLDLMMQDCLAKGMTPQEMKETINTVLNDVNSEISADDNKFAAGKVTTMTNWVDKASDQVAGYYDVMKKKEGKENMAENTQDAENTTLPAVQGQGQEMQQEPETLMPAVRNQETQLEQTETLMPAVRENLSPEKVQEEPMQLSEQEMNVALSMSELAMNPSKEKGEEYLINVSKLLAEYQAGGMSYTESVQHASEFLDQLVDRAKSQNMDSQVITNLSNLRDRTVVEMAQEAARRESNAETMTLDAVNNVDEAEYEEVPTTPVAENEGQEEEGPAGPATPVAENEGLQGTFGFSAGNTIREHEPPADEIDPPKQENLDDLLAQMQNTAFKNRYTLLEDTEIERPTPFKPLKWNTLEISEDEKNPYVKMELENGTRLYNRPNQVDIHYDTIVTADGQKKPQLTFEDCMSAVRLGMEKGWTSATLEGPKEYQEQMYLAMRAMGMRVVGYTPSAELEKKGDELAKMHAPDRKHAADLDRRFDKIEARRKEAGIKEPEEVGRDFMDSLKDRGLQYIPVKERQEEEVHDGPEATDPTPTQTTEQDGPEVTDATPTQTTEQDGPEVERTTALPAVVTPNSAENSNTETPNLPAVVTPEIQNKMDAVAQETTTALAVYNPKKAQQATAAIAEAPSISTQLQLAGEAKNQAVGIEARTNQAVANQQKMALMVSRGNQGNS